jgi:hypothetical protein
VQYEYGGCGEYGGRGEHSEQGRMTVELFGADQLLYLELLSYDETIS